MSKEIDDRIDGLRQRLIATAATPISMGNYKQQLRTYQEMMMELIKIVDEVNSQSDQISPAEVEALKKHVAEAFAKAAEGDT